MKIAKKNIVLFFLLILIAAYTYFYEVKHVQKQKSEKEIALHLFHVPKDSIVTIQVTNTYGTFEFSKNIANKWWIVHPVETEAEQSKIIDILDDIENLKRVESVEPIISQDLDQFGLNKPEFSVKVVTKHNKTDSLWIGTTTPIDNNLFASKGDSVVFVIPSSFKYTINKGLYDWRLKKILVFNQSDIDSIVIHYKKPIYLVKKDGKWILKNINKEADESNISTLLSKFSNTNFKRVVEEKRDNLQKYGLNYPLASISFYDKQEKQVIEHSAVIGRREQNVYYAYDKSRPMIFTIDTNVVKYILKPISFFRNHDFARVNRNLIDSIVVSYDTTKIIAVKDSSTWYALTDTGRVKLKNWKISGLISDLDFAQITDFVSDNMKNLSKFGLTSPSLLIRFYNGKDLLNEFIFGKVIKDKVYAVNQKKKEIVKLPKHVLENCKLKLEDIMEKK